MYRDPFQTIARVAQRSTSAVLARAGTESSVLRAHLNALMEGMGKPKSFLKESLIEAAHGFVTAEERLGKGLQSSLCPAERIRSDLLSPWRFKTPL